MLQQKPDFLCEDIDNSSYDYLRYTTYYKSNTDSADMISSNSAQKLVSADIDIPIPKRSPRRLQSNKLMDTSDECTNIPLSPAMSATTSSTSFSDKEYTSDDTDSIFSNCEYHKLDKNNYKYGFNGFNEDDLEIEALLEEFELDEEGNSNIVFAIDDVVTIIGMHSGADLKIV